MPAWLASEFEKTIVRHYFHRQTPKYYLSEFAEFLRASNREEAGVLEVGVGEEVGTAVRERVRAEEERFLEWRQMALLGEEPEKKKRRKGKKNANKEGGKSEKVLECSKGLPSATAK